MCIELHTPTGTVSFLFTIDQTNQRINITTLASGNIHSYDSRAINDLYDWLRNEQNGEWVYLGSINENVTPNPNTVEAWARDPNNPIGGFYGLTPHFRGRFASYIPSILEYLGLAELEHNPRNNRMRALL